jgi:PPP family 3-phenylpropionic acid transporter
MGVQRDLLLRFLILYGMLYCSFGFSSPFLPEFLMARGIGAEWLGLLLGVGTALRMLSAPLAGRLADVFAAFRLELALFSIAAAVASVLYLPAHTFWLLVLVNLTQAAMLAPLAPLADALALSWSRPTTRGNTAAFEYGWVRGVGSAAFIAGVLVAGQSAGAWGLSSVLSLTAAGLFATALSTRFVPDLAGGPNDRKRKVIEGDWLILLRQPAFVRMVLAAALVIGSHGMHDAFAIIRWRDAGISSGVSSMLWSESVGAEVLVFVLLGPWLLSLLGRSGALALAAGAAVVRWGVMAQTADITAVALVEPLHGLTFAGFHLGCMRIIADTVPSSLAGMAQAFYGTVGIGGATALSTILSGWLFARWGPAGFWGMAFLCGLAFPVIWSLRIALSQDLSLGEAMTDTITSQPSVNPAAINDATVSKAESAAATGRPAFNGQAR